MPPLPPRAALRPLRACALLAALAACARPAAPPPPPKIAYVIPPAWHTGPVWFYPREQFGLTATGLATLTQPPPAGLTADHEAYSADAMAAAMQNVQLPAIARITNLQTGRSVVVRVNDVGPSDPRRLIAVTPRVATLLGLTGPTQIRVAFDPAQSLALRQQLLGAGAGLRIQTAPRAAVAEASLPPLPGAQSTASRQVSDLAQSAQAADPPPLAIPLHLPEALTAGPPSPGRLMLEAGLFTHQDAAERRLDALGNIGARLIRSLSGGVLSYQIEAGPFATVPDADAAFGRAVEDGVTDATIVVRQD